MVFVASEAVPFAKTGGLGRRPRCSASRDRATRATPPSVFLPAYRSCTRPPVVPISAHRNDAPDPGRRHRQSRIASSRSACRGSAVKVYLIDQPRYFDRDGLYGSDGKDYEDNCERFVFFNRAVLEAIGPLGIRARHHSLQRLADGLDSGLHEDALSAARSRWPPSGRCSPFTTWPISVYSGSATWP